MSEEDPDQPVDVMEECFLNLLGVLRDKDVLTEEEASEILNPLWEAGERIGYFED